MKITTLGPDLASATWRKSTYSAGDGGNCLEVTADFPGLAPVRDSKNPHGPALTFRAPAWAAFIATLQRLQHPQHP
jgi:hypothetical protein